MTVKIFIKRKVQDQNAVELTLLLKRLRALTLEQPGYISGETLTRIDKKDECMVISTWRSVEDWNSWVNNPKRIEIQMQIDKLLGQETDYAMYSA
ncbi:antibiotic biosynthesis monooxygenase [Desulfopila sp. IMCC35006]|uniref:antibiotic biosynthesis monooxygenase family protein n=1 Tax=Desulfopila sp. IMCC35006 TaxID=2569542 RepID=UPI0010ABF585|nr:antibiotic biosynthesis monooxygenase [Desulfopila sp. IMCC35006]TKB28140.1 antibiotic biosynthesis monooxygenase [Desulfopila sp. IMCC35006]